MRNSILLTLPLLLLACTPGYVKVGEESELSEENENNNENNSEDRENRCCYTIDMFDAEGNGWDQGFIEVVVDDELYAKVSLPAGEGYQEICPAQGSELSMYWHSAEANEEVGFVVYSPSDNVVAQERRPEEGTFLKEWVECAEDVAVSPDYQEEGNIGDVIFPDDPDDPGDPTDPDDPEDHPDPDESPFEGEYWGYFRLMNAQTGYQVCEAEMPIEIYDWEFISQGPCYTPNGHELFIEHRGNLEIEEGGWGGGSNGGGPGGMPPEFAYGYTYGGVAMTVPSGDSFTSEFWGECYSEGGYVGMYVWWEMVVQAPNETRYYQGELQAY